MFVVLELIEAGAGGGEKNDVAGDGGLGCALDGIFQSFRVLDFGSALNLRFDFGGCGPDGVNPLHSGAQQVVEDRVVAALVLAAEDQVNVGREGFESLDSGVDVGRLGVVVVVDAGDFGDKFQAMFDGLEILNGLADLFGLAADQHTYRNCG